MAVNANTLINFGSGGLEIGDVTYSARPLSAPAYLPLNDDTASYLSSSYPTLAATYAPAAVSYSAVSKAFAPVYSFGTTGGVLGIWNFLFGNKTFIGWTVNGNIATSTDLTTWVTKGIPNQPILQGQTGTTTSNATSTYTNPANNGWVNVAYGAGKLVAIRPLTSNLTYTTAYGLSAMSLDNGSTWVFGSMPTYNTSYTSFAGQKMNYVSLFYGNGQFLAFGWYYDSGSTILMFCTRSSDGVTWSDLTYTTFSGITTLQAAAYGNGVWVLFNGNSTQCRRSTDNGLTFSAGGNPNTLRTQALAFGAGLFVAVGTTTDPVATATYWTSPDGSTWTQRTLPATQSWSSITYANGYFVAVGTTGAASTVVVSSPDGINWTSQTVPSTTNRYGVAGGDGKFVYYNDASLKTVTQINLSAAASTFTLPMIPPLPGTQAYIKAT